MFLIRAFTSFEKYKYAGEISGEISVELRIYIPPDAIEKVAKTMCEIKRKWTRGSGLYEDGCSSN